MATNLASFRLVDPQAFCIAVRPVVALKITTQTEHIESGYWNLICHHGFAVSRNHGVGASGNEPS